MKVSIAVSCSKEIGWRPWTVRVNGVVVADFHRSSSAWELAFRLSSALGLDISPPQRTDNE